MTETKKLDPAAVAELKAKEAADKAVEMARAAERAATEQRKLDAVAEAAAQAKARQADADARVDALDERIAALPGKMSDLVERLKESASKGRTDHAHVDYTASFVSHVENIAAETVAWIKRHS
ncbi:hypothetical protein OIU35_31615 [Boseaceae bacterium BT-24-1]|nr:hypothetical protein [Boseaceae bacterium BT-24-1]